MPSDEFELINKIVRDKSYFKKYDIIGPGDDCSVFADNLLITTDTIIEEVHFKLNYSSFYDVGWKSIAVSLSDIAAMCGEPLVCTVALTLREGITEQNIEELYKGIYELADQHALQIVGGDTTKSKVLSVTTTVVGKAISKPILRSSAKSGDGIWLSNKIGLAQIGLESFVNNEESKYRAFHTRPNPRLGLAKYLAENNLVNSMLDVSDGLFQDLMHLCKDSGLSANIESEKIQALTSFADDSSRFLKLCSSGDDYELLFSSSKENESKLASLDGVAQIGSFTAGQAEIFLDGVSIQEIMKKSDLKSLGYKHF